MRKTALLLLVWLCAVRSDAAQPVSIELDLTRSVGKISPMLYGQFVEHMFEGVKGGLYAEMLRNGSFEQWPETSLMPSFWFRYPDDRNDDYGLKLRRNAVDYYPMAGQSAFATNGHSMRLVAENGVVSRHGFYQPSLSVQAEREYQGSLWIQSSKSGKIRIALEEDLPGGGTLSESTLEIQQGQWRQYSFRLKPNRSELHVRFCILADAPFSGDLDQISLMPADHIDTVRRDVFEKVNALRPAFVRWPGGNVAQDYHWIWGVGAREQRLTWTNLSWNNELEPSGFGTAEFVTFCRNLHAEPTITVNVEGLGATADEAAAWVEYCNSPVQTRFGSIRAQHGHPSPFRVKYWEIGNEIWGDWVRGHSDAESYAGNLLRYVRQMRRVDPTIKVIAVGDNNMDWNRTVLKAAAKEIDYLAVHHYFGWRESRSNLVTLLGRPAVFEKLYSDLKKLCTDFAPERNIKLAINEWGLDVPEQMQYSVVSALYAARMLNLFERTGDFVGMSAVSDLVNGWPGGIIQVQRDRLFVSPIYLVNSVYASNTGTDLLTCKISGREPDESQNSEPVDVCASLSADGSEMYLHVINLDTQQPIGARIILSGREPEAKATVYTVAASDLQAANSFATPDGIRVTEESVPAAAAFNVELPKHSVRVYRFRLKQS